MSLRFGTDGIRGDAERDLDSRFVRAFARAAVSTLGFERPWLLGRDTRESGPRIVTDFAAGCSAAGGECHDLGVVPTPAVAFASVSEGAPAAMVSASHNPWWDNGIKLFEPGGQKLSDATEAAIERATVREIASGEGGGPASAELVAYDPDHVGYEHHLLDALAGRRLDGMKVVLDCANGAASVVAPEVLRALGAQVAVIHAAPDGRNINDGCGSTAPDDLRAAVTAAGVDAGLAFDGDADRVIAVDERGDLIDGDEMLLIVALDRFGRGELTNGGVAITVMSNLGLRTALRDAGITVVTTPVGDRHVLRALADHGLALGGEQSGHIVFAEHATTGDGLLTGLVLLDVVRRSGRRLSELTQSMTRYPQVLENVVIDGPVDLQAAEGICKVVTEIEGELGNDGRVLLRTSGTEPLVRVMVEARDASIAAAAANRLVGAVRKWFDSSDRS